MATDAPPRRPQLPERPDLAQLKKQARDLQRRTPGLALTQAQLAIAREHGFASWVRLKQHVDAISTRSWVAGRDESGCSAAELLADRACLTYAGRAHDEVYAAARALRADRTLSSSALLPAVIASDVAAVREHLRNDPTAVARPSGPRGWTPLMYLAFARTDAPAADVLACARLMLDAGADPDDGRFFAGLAVPFTVLTGLFGGGERGEPAHPHALEVAQVLLERGAEANDAQALYNMQFEADDRSLELLFRHGLGRGDGGPWRRLLPDLLVSPRALLRRLLRWAVEHDQRARVEMLAAHGVDVGRLPGGSSSLRLALVSGNPQLADLLRGLGVAEPDIDAADAFVAAASAGDREAASATSAAVVRHDRPGLLVWAAGLGRPEAVDLLVDAGFDVDALGRGDVGADDPWQTALHTAVENGHAAIVRRLLDLGADRTIRDARFDGTPLDWAEHLHQLEIAELLRPAD